MRYPTTDTDICHILAVGIATHPLILDPPIYSPVKLAGKPPTQIKIKKVRLFGGRELTEQGLTLSVYPSYVDSKGTKVPTSVFKVDTIGERNGDGYREEVKARYTIELALLDPDFDTPYKIPFRKLTQDSSIISHSDRIDYTNDPGMYSEILESQVSLHKLEVVVLPAEETLRSYMSLIRDVLRDLNSFRPYFVRRPIILDVSYPTADILDKASTNMVFHRAFLHVEFVYYETTETYENYVNELIIKNNCV